jgi:hypothetical protein
LTPCAGWSGNILNWFAYQPPIEKFELQPLDDPNIHLGVWGKAQPREDSAPQWHLLAHHMLDVAAVASALLQTRPISLARASGGRTPKGKL